MQTRIPMKVLLLADLALGKLAMKDQCLLLTEKEMRTLLDKIDLRLSPLLLTIYTAGYSGIEGEQNDSGTLGMACVSKLRETRRKIQAGTPLVHALQFPDADGDCIQSAASVATEAGLIAPPGVMELCLNADLRAMRMQKKWNSCFAIISPVPFAVAESGVIVPAASVGSTAIEAIGHDVDAATQVPLALSGGMLEIRDTPTRTIRDLSSDDRARFQTSALVKLFTECLRPANNQEEVKDAVTCAGMKDLVIFSDDLAAEIKDLQILSDPMSDKYDDRQLTKAKENFENDKGRKLHKSVSFLNTGMALLDNVSTAIAQRAQDGALGQDAICVKDQVKTVGEAVCTTERNIVTLRMKLVWKEVLEYTVRIYTKGSERFRMIHKVGIKIGELPQL